MVYLHVYHSWRCCPHDIHIGCCNMANLGIYSTTAMYGPKKSGATECLLIIGTGCRVQVFIAWSSIAQSVCQQAFSLLANRCLRPSGFESCLQQRKTTCLLSIRITLACARASKLTTTDKHYSDVTSALWPPKPPGIGCLFNSVLTRITPRPLIIRSCDEKIDRT